MSRLGDVAKRIMESERTVGTGVVSAVEGPRVVRLHGRSERVLVAGSSLPKVGDRVGWVRLDRNRVVTTKHAPRRTPFAAVAEKGRAFGVGYPLDDTADFYDNWQSFGSQPAIVDRNGDLWVVLMQWMGEDTYRINFWRGDGEDLLSASSWRVVAYIELTEESGQPRQYVYGCVCSYFPCVALHGDKLFVWWWRSDVWATTGVTEGMLQGVVGVINEDSITLGDIVSLDVPTANGMSFSGDGTTYSAAAPLMGPPALVVDDDGYLWLEANAYGDWWGELSYEVVSGVPASGEQHHKIIGGWVGPDGKIYAGGGRSFNTNGYDQVVRITWESGSGPTGALCRKIWCGEQHYWSGDPWWEVATLPPTGRGEVVLHDFSEVGAQPGPFPNNGFGAMFVGRSRSPLTFADGVDWSVVIRPEDCETTHFAHPWYWGIDVALLATSGNKAYVVYKTTDFELATKSGSGGGAWSAESILIHNLQPPDWSYGNICSVDSVLRDGDHAYVAWGYQGGEEPFDIWGEYVTTLHLASSATVASSQFFENVENEMKLSRSAYGTYLHGFPFSETLYTDPETQEQWLINNVWRAWKLTAGIWQPYGDGTLTNTYGPYFQSVYAYERGDDTLAVMWHDRMPPESNDYFLCVLVVNDGAAQG